MEQLILALVICGLIGLVVLAFVIVHLREKKRSEALHKLAQQLGLGFAQNATQELLARFGHLPLFRHGRARRANNHLHGDYGGVRLAVFDYRYTTGSGKNSSTWVQTVIAVESPDFALPVFTCSPESPFAKLASVFGYQDIDFPSHPEFSKRFLLRGPDEPNVRGLFTPGVMEFFEQRRGYTAEAAGDLFVYFRAARRAKPEELVQLIADGLALYRELTVRAA